MPGRTSKHVKAATKYARDVVGGKIPACTWVVAACRRQLDDLEREKNDPKWPYRFDVDAADRVCRFIELLPHVKGVWARDGELIKLEPWQQFSLTTAFGWLDKETGYRRFNVVYIEVPRKNAKSTLTSGVSLYALAADGEYGAECYSAATKKDQAKIVFGDAQKMARRSPGFRARFGVQVFANHLSVVADGSKFEALDSEGSTQDGLNIHFCANDEVHAWKKRDLYDAIDTATGARTQPLIWNITTSGSNQAGICYEQRIYLTKILKGSIRDETFFGIIYTLDEGDDWRKPASWRKANPNYGVSVYKKDIERLCRKAQNSRSSVNSFKTKRLDLWVNADVAWMDMDLYDACADTGLRLEDFVNERCHIGLDLADKKDISAAMLLFARGDDIYAFGRYYLSQWAVDQSDNAAMSGWVDEQLVTVTPGNATDFDVIEQELIADGERFAEVEVDFDPHQASQLVTHVMEAGIECVEVRPNVLNFSEPMKEFEARVMRGKFHHNGDPVLRWMVANVICHLDNKDNIYPRKERPENKIDGVVAIISALNRMLRGEPEVEFEYQSGQMFA